MSDDVKPLSETLRSIGGRGPIGDWLASIHAEQHRRNEVRRERVLRYADLREALTKPPLSFSRAEIWNGYVPPRYEQDAPSEMLHDRAGYPNRDRTRTRPTGTNETAERAMLVAICTDAYQRDVEAGLADGEHEPDLLEQFPFPFPGLPRGKDYPHEYRLVQPALDDRQAAPAERADFQHEPLRGPGRQ